MVTVNYVLIMYDWVVSFFFSMLNRAVCVGPHSLSCSSCLCLLNFILFNHLLSYNTKHRLCREIDVKECNYLWTCIPRNMLLYVSV